MSDLIVPADQYLLNLIELKENLGHFKLSGT